jgi:hypothetical protein
MRDGVFGAQFYGTTKFAFCPDEVTVVMKPDEAERGVRIGAIIVSLDRFEGGLLGALPRVCRRWLNVPVHQGVAVGHFSPRQRE